MGFALFESSGTFNPANYGLVVGDTIQVVAVGGGRGGNGSEYDSSVEVQGSNGGASSFGSFASAPGGNAVASTGVTTPLSGGEANGSVGGDGEHGWGSILWHAGSIWSPGLDCDLLACIAAHGAMGEIRNGGKTDLAENGEAYASSTTNAGGRGGLGYGAGGGGGASASNRNNGARAASGGKAGTIKIVAVKLANLKAISVTVGTGGAGGSAKANGGKGANGCVAVFW